MKTHNKNIVRALAILATNPDELDIAFQARCVLVAGQKLCLHDDDDREVLSILMAGHEFGYAVSAIEDTAAQLREMQRVYDRTIEHFRPASIDSQKQMTDAQALSEIEEAKRILDKHYDSHFLLGIWQEDLGGVCYRYADGRYAELAERDSEDEAA